MSSFGKGHSPNPDFFFLHKKEKMSLEWPKPKQDVTHLGKFTGFQTEKDAKLHRIWTNTCNKERPNLKIW